MVEFVSYDGDYPNLCSGILILLIDRETVKFPNYSMRSGGCTWFDDEWNEHVSYGEWDVKVPEKYAHLKDEIKKCVNDNVLYGCCGGCL